MKTTECKQRVFLRSICLANELRLISNGKMFVHERHASIGIIGTAWKMKYHAQYQLTRNCRCFEIPWGDGRMESRRTFVRSIQSDRAETVCDNTTEREPILYSRISSWTYRSGFRKSMNLLTRLVFTYRIVSHVCRDWQVENYSRDPIMKHQITHNIEINIHYYLLTYLQ